MPLPKTFKEAFEVTRNLECHYLWLDTLCIIQDDTIDVEKEMAQMGKICRDANVTIVADNGPDTEPGLFAARDPRSLKSCIITTTFTVYNQRFTIHDSFGCRYRGETYRFTRETGWTLQAERMSGHLLIFTTKYVEFSCMSEKVYEFTPSFLQHRKHLQLIIVRRSQFLRMSDL